jgi:hypothetical protein
MRILAFILLCAPAAFAAEFGTFMLVKGKVLIINGKSESTEAKVSSKIYVGETVVTDNDSRAKIIMSDRNVLNILPNTKMKIERYTNEGENKEVQLNLIEGKVRSNVGEKYDNKSSRFEIRTATAVAGVRGTEFITSYDPKTKVTEVLTIHGQVSFKVMGLPNVTEAPEVLVNKQERSEQKGDASPSKPEKIPKKEFDAVNKDTNVAGDKKGDLKKSKGGKEAEDATVNERAPGVVETTPVNSGDLLAKPPISTQPLVAPPDKTKVNVIIK